VHKVRHAGNSTVVLDSEHALIKEPLAAARANDSFPICRTIASSRSALRRASDSGRRERQGERSTVTRLHAIRKGQIRWLAKGYVVGQRQFIHALFGIAA